MGVPTVNMLRILVAADTFAPDVNGAARFADRLSAGLAARGHDVHVVAPSPTGSAYTEVHDDGVVVHRLVSRRLPGLDAMRVCLPWEVSPEVKRVFAEVRPDVVHTNGHMLLGRAVVQAALRAEVPVVATNHLMPENIVGYLPLAGPLQDVFAEWMYRDLGRVYSQADVVTAPTPRAVDLIARRSGLAAAFPVSNGIDAAAFEQVRTAVAARRSTPGGPDTLYEPTVLFVGRLDQEKRVDELIRAFARIAPDVPGRLEVVGDGACRATWEALADRLGVAQRVRFRGRVSDDELLGAYGTADLFCMPGVSELQSIVTMEAMAAGLPVVAADAMALPHLVRPGTNGELFTPGDIDGLAVHLRTLLTDVALRERYGSAGRELIEAHTMGATLGIFEALYEKVMNGAPVAA
ncbi:Glycosyltransferase involved in cell wall bisynthesis [Promicromonospora umidemergens]|uniref:glycosyltransferase n=1 Tax=Promicromonospora umidemergens TaxID=629679 RepID=UPI0020A2BCE7|nr:glycosyltransferase [Promicromonospora umidemergens]MCP2284683.1 Glycosyltransferase involved in cell wall bisynthesis [Promicromonospora umidemergens]